MERQTLRDWVYRFNAEGVDGLKDRQRSGRKPLLKEEQRAKLDELVETPPDPVKDGVVRWRCSDLKARIKTLFGVEISPRSVGRILRQRKFRRLAPRPQHPKAERGPTAHFSESFASILWKRLPEHAKGKPIEVWFQEEARVGQKGTLTRIWARKGRRPRAVCDTRYEWAYLFGAVSANARRGRGSSCHTPTQRP